MTPMWPAASAMVDEVARETGICRDWILGESRLGPISAARQEVWRRLYLRKDEGWSYPAIGRAFQRDHSTVMYGIAAAEKRLAKRGLLPPAHAGRCLATGTGQQCSAG